MVGGLQLHGLRSKQVPISVASRWASTVRTGRTANSHPLSLCHHRRRRRPHSHILRFAASSPFSAARGGLTSGSWWLCNRRRQSCAWQYGVLSKGWSHRVVQPIKRFHSGGSSPHWPSGLNSTHALSQILYQPISINIWSVLVCLHDHAMTPPFW